MNIYSFVWTLKREREMKEAGVSKYQYIAVGSTKWSNGNRNENGEEGAEQQRWWDCAFCPPFPSNFLFSILSHSPLFWPSWLFFYISPTNFISFFLCIESLQYYLMHHIRSMKYMKIEINWVDYFKWITTTMTVKRYCRRTYCVRVYGRAVKD